MSDEGAPPRKGIEEGTAIAILIVIGLVVLGFFYGPRLLDLDSGRAGSHAEPPEQAQMRFINLVMFSYANDNGMKYPTGKSSTEVFQKLLDEKYCSDPAIFYFPMPGKTKPTSSTLKPDNVCFDVTIAVTDKDPDQIPIVFSTGYRMVYGPGGSAFPLTAGTPKFPGIFVAYKSNSATFIKDDGTPSHIVPNAVPTGFSSGGKTFQQLTPDGVLPP